MIKKKNGQAGFSVIEFLIILVVIVALGAVGYLVWHNNHKVTTANNSTVTTTNSSSNNQSTTSSSVVRTTLPKTPEAMQTAIINYETSHKCIANGQAQFEDGPGPISDLTVQYVANRAAMLGCGGLEDLFAYSKGQWIWIAGGQDYYDCNTLEQYKVPSSLVGSSCGLSTGSVESYSQS